MGSEFSKEVRQHWEEVRAASNKLVDVFEKHGVAGSGINASACIYIGARMLIEEAVENKIDVKTVEHAIKIALRFAAEDATALNNDGSRREDSDAS